MAVFSPSFAGFTEPYKFWVYRGSAQSMAGSGSTTKVQFDTKVFDTGSNYDNVTNFQFTVPVTGYWVIGAQGSLLGATAVWNTAVFLGGVLFFSCGQFNAGTNNVGVGSSRICSLSSGNILDVRIFNNGSTVNCNTGQGTTDFWGFLLSIS